MGLFTPSYCKEHDFEWYYTPKASKKYNSLSFLRDFEKIEFLYTFVKSLPNSKNFIFDRYNIAKVLFWLSNSEYIDKWGNKTNPEWSGYENLIDRTKNPFLDLVMRLNHKLYENKTLTNVLLTCTLFKCLDLDGEHRWIVDDPEFWNDEKDIFQRFMDRLQLNIDIELTPDMIKNVL